MMTTTTSASSSVMFTRNLTMGSRGADVTALQNWLIGKGFSIAAGATGYFGAQTRAALAAYQAANGITPAAGFFGPVTRAMAMAGGSMTGGSTVPGCMPGAMYSSTTGQACGTTTTGGTTSGPLMGAEGSISDFKIIGATVTNLNSADQDTVYGVEFRATGSDLQVNRVDYNTYLSTAGSGTASTRPWTVFGKAMLMRGNTTIATRDASDMNNWSQDGTASNGNTIYRLRFDGINDVVKMDTKAQYYLQLTTQSNVNQSNNGNVFTLFLPSQGIRATDARGISQYSSSSNQTNATVSVSSSVSGSLTLSTASDNPQTTTVQANSSSQTSDVLLTSFTLQAKDGDVTIYTVPLSIATTSNNASDIVRVVKLYQGSTLLDTESYSVGSASTSVKFKNLNVKIPMGQTQTFWVKADINQVGGQNNTVVEGASVALSVPNTGWEAVNTAGNNVTITGSVTGNVITFRSLGIAIDAMPTSATATSQTVNTTSGQQQGNFTFTFNVTAFGQDVYFSKNAGNTIGGTIYSNGTATNIASTTALTSTADTSTGNSQNYVIHSGQTKQVTVTITIPAGSNAPLNAVLNSFKWGTTDGAPSANTASFNNNYQTAPVFLHA
jgi:hypothetical protein